MSWVALKNVRNASRLGLFSLGAQQPSLRWLWGRPGGVSSPRRSLVVPSQCQTGRMKHLAPSPSSLTLHSSLPGPGEAGGFLTQHAGPPCFS